MEQMEELVASKEIKSFEIITLFVREVFGTYFIEEGNWTFDDGNAIIGRTYFADRKRYKKAVNYKTVLNIRQIYKMALTGHSTYNADSISQAFTQMYKKRLGLNVDYLMFFDDDSEILRSRKIQMIIQLVGMVLFRFDGKESIPSSDFHVHGNVVKEKTMSFIANASKDTYTEIVLQNMFNTDPDYKPLKDWYAKLYHWI